MKNLKWKMENPVVWSGVMAHRKATGFAIYHFPYVIFHLHHFAKKKQATRWRRLLD